MPVRGDSGAALAFLQWVRPTGPWCLTSIPPEHSGRTTTETFDSSNEATLVAWLESFQGKQNLYWTVNGLKGPMTIKPSKEDIEELQFLHVDLDPEKGRELEPERARIFAKLTAFQPQPSAIIDSGGGFQGFWRLDEPLFIGGDAVRIGDAEAYNKQLELLLGGDHCFNVDRIMRLPGTVNVPDKKKRERGRVEALASAVELTDRRWPLDHFLPAPRVQGSNGGVAATVKISGNLSPVLIDDLPEGVTPRIRMLIVQGTDPDDPTRYGSRSEVVWAVCCAMVRGGCSDDVIASVLLDPDYAVSAHVLAQRRSPEYAARQIQKAREEVEEPMLRLLNDKHAVIEDLGGRCRVISEVLDPTVSPPRLRISKQTFDDFRNRYMNRPVQVGTTKQGDPVYKAAGAWWLSHPLRRQYRTLVFSPGQEVEGAYNLWQGFSCEALPGLNHEPFLEHVKNNICSGNEEHFNYLMGWMAYAVQNPARAGEVAVVLRGGRGTGKGTLATVFGSLWGRHFMPVSSAKHLVGQFNAHLRDCILLYADEAFFAGDKQHESVLKTLITESTMVVEPKGVDAEVAPNYIHLIMSSNENWVVPAGADERRFFVLNVGEGKKQDRPYFRALLKAMNNGGRESLLYHLMTLDLSDFDVRAVPQTAALQSQKVYSLTCEEAWWLERLMDGRTLASEPGWNRSVLKERLQGDYLRYAEAQRVMRRVSPVALGMFLGRIMPGDYPIGQQRTTDVERRGPSGEIEVVRARAYFYDLPSLEVCRVEWDTRYGGAFEWPSEGPVEMERAMSEPY